MFNARSRAAILALFGTFALMLSSCSYLRDVEPFTITIEYNEDATGSLVVTPLEFEADAAYGQVQVVNNTQSRHGFAIRELGVFEEILEKTSFTVGVEEARDGKSYTFTCHVHPGEFAGTMKVVFLSEEER